ncbi:kinase-like domain-containing protein [Lineolata rhizophorae]|uniref:Kinase-like domain-containing protein n=1 Tax=Lineolata rhizophorae TaxID=578093 RepID=A0A6A6NZM6_9PEZI|nr:kinase-like domain-containing protein [Lineolata rhizophorae]
MAEVSNMHNHVSAEDVPDVAYARDISLAIPATGETGRPPTVKHMSAPAYQSPLRHHHRAHSSSREVKETLNARSEYSNSEDDGTAQHRINQYIIKQEIGRGSFGAVHLAVDQFGQEYAVKEFSKSRLRKRAQSNLLRRPNVPRRTGQLAAGMGFNSPLHRQGAASPAFGQRTNPLDLIREEIAIMKKLNHPNLVSLIEVLDDPDEDSLYMVMEMCKKGVVMKVGLDERADPYDKESCRCWFRDMILGIEYLHAQGVIHRDIKPDNCLITQDDVLKIVDFGVSEMFEKESEMSTSKSAGSPAFMPPELCVAKHGNVSGKAADIWSMGVTLYCLRFGRIPFEKTSVLELYDSIRSDNVEIEPPSDDDFRDLMQKLLEKDPSKRIKMAELREHPWVTKKGTDTLLSTEENIAELLEPPTEEELNAAITGKLGRLMVVMKAARRFKQLLLKRRPELMEGIFGRGSRIVQPPLSMRPNHLHVTSKSVDTHDRRPVEGALAAEGVHRGIDISDELKRLPEGMTHVAISAQDLPAEADPAESSQLPDEAGPSPRIVRQNNSATAEGETESRKEWRKGQAHDPLEDTLFLNIGPGPGDVVDVQNNVSWTNDGHVVSESPAAVDINVYESAYQEEIQRILAAKGRGATLYLTRRVEGNKAIRENENIFDHCGPAADAGRTAVAKLLSKAKDTGQSALTRDPKDEDAGGSES